MSLSRPPKRYSFGWGVVDIMDQPWWTDLLTGGLVVAWMGWTFATMQEYGPSPALIGGAVLVGLVGVLALHGQYVTYLKLGEWVTIGREPPKRDNLDEPREGTRSNELTRDDT